jgi:hypothetical protein
LVSTARGVTTDFFTAVICADLTPLLKRRIYLSVVVDPLTIRVSVVLTFCAFGGDKETRKPLDGLQKLRMAQ